MTWLLSYVGSNFALIAVVILAVVALGAVAWFAKNWKVAVAAVVVLAAGLAYQQIDKSAYQRAMAERYADQIKTLSGRIALLKQVTMNDAAQASQDATEIETLRGMVSQTPTNSGPCLDEGAAKRIGAVR